MGQDTQKRDALLKKLKVLAERGVGGEKENAQLMLDRMLKKCGMTYEDLEAEVVDVHTIQFKDDLHEKFTHQIIASVLGKVTTWGYKRLKKTIIFESSLAEFIEIKAKRDFFFRDYIRQQQLFYKAYIQKNELYAKTEGEPEGDSKMSMKEYMELMSMMSGIEKQTFRTQLDKKPMQIEHNDE